MSGESADYDAGLIPGKVRGNEKEKVSNYRAVLKVSLCWQIKDILPVLCMAHYQSHQDLLIV